MMETKLIEEVVDNVISEELGVSNEVVNLTSIIEHKLIEYINNGIYEYDFLVKTKLSKLNVSYVFKDFNDENEANKWIEYERGNDGYSYKNNTIYLSIFSINGEIDFNELSDTIQHECSHFWEMKNMQRDLYSSDYQDVINGIRNKNPYVSMVYSVIYYSNKNEINAFVNGSFSSAMKKRKPYADYKEFIEDNSVYNVYSELNDALESMKRIDIENDVTFELAAMVIGCDKYYLYDFIMKSAKIGLQYLLLKVGKVYSLYLEKTKNGDN